MATLKIIRTGDYINRLRDIRLFLGNKGVGKISNGETMEFKVSKETHTLHVKIDWCMSKGFSFTVTESQTQTVDLCSFASQNPLKLPAMIYYITLGTSEYLILREQAI